MQSKNKKKRSRNNDERLSVCRGNGRNGGITVWMSISLVAAVLFLAGCGTLNTLKPGISKSDIRARLDVIEQDYSAAKDKLVEYRAQGLIDDPTWAELVRLDQRFSDEWSMAIVELNAGEDWRETVLFVAGILSQLSAAGIDGGIAQGINAVAGLAVALTREKTMEEVR